MALPMYFGLNLSGTFKMLFVIYSLTVSATIISFNASLGEKQTSIPLNLEDDQHKRSHQR